MRAFIYFKHLTFQLALCLILVAPAAKAQEFSAPDKTRRQEMNYEEYRELREKMRTRMEKRHEDQRQQPQEERVRPEREERDSAYGQGYNSRRLREERSGAAPDRRPNRPRFNHGERARP